MLLGGAILGERGRAEDFQGSTHKLNFDSPPISYSKAEATDPVAKLAKILRADRSSGWKDFHPDFGYLPVVLEMLQVPVSSQMLVFSKTSVQRHNIEPANPRALYFSDAIYVGFIPGAPELEIAAVDPDLGTVFYTVHQDKDEPVRFRRNDECLLCHGSARSMGVPGFVLRSLDTDPTGEIVAATDTDRISHCTSIAERWGGWYVTNAPAGWVHRGNDPGHAVRDPKDLEALVQKVASSRRYPAAGSDTLALLLHDHQTHMHNYITRLHMEGQQRLSEYGHIKYLDIQIRAFLRYLLFTEEAPLPSPLEPAPEFLTAFQKNAKRDARGRSLKDLDLNTRLFRYPCSFLLDSEAFRKLPDPVRLKVLERLHDILTNAETHPDFAAISAEQRQAVLEILRDTAPDLTVGW
ncbi:MAG: hypothetical protein DVB28_000291 [Verrucomicrobia bacterium]|nr:MAG: hypothetical protein DVB28_000291 [Verrucomicrobiota bacterium]